MDKFLKIVAAAVVVVAVVVESQEHRPLVLSGQDGGSNMTLVNVSTQCGTEKQ